jgi:hypothetical protein
MPSPSDVPKLHLLLTVPCEVPILATRLEKIRNVLVELIEKFERQIIVPGCWCRKDGWKRLVQDNLLLNVNVKFEDLTRIKMEVTRRRPSNFKSIK